MAFTQNACFARQLFVLRNEKQWGTGFEKAKEEEVKVGVEDEEMEEE